MSRSPLLSVNGLTVAYRTAFGEVKAIQNINLSIYSNEVHGIVGETGCGKSTLALSLIGLLPPQARIVAGSIWYKGIDLTRLSEPMFTQLRGTEIAMVFQEPMSSLNPVYTVGEQVAEAVIIRRARETRARYRGPGVQEPYVYPAAAKAQELRGSNLMTRLFGVRFTRRRPARILDAGLREEVIRYLRMVRIYDPERIVDKYPHQLSGGMRQRVMLAMALALRPSLLIADEPTSALDVITQAQILKLLRELTKDHGSSVLLISHDFGVIAETADRVAVMYAGQVVEQGLTERIFEEPLHPYTKMLLGALPRGYYDSPPLDAIPGSVPDPAFPPTGCKFHPRCPQAFSRCKREEPPMRAIERKGGVACFLYEGP
ncbi:MAG: peptide ABC transporter ATP-binding protein [Nitrososphaerota archaeon]